MKLVDILAIKLKSWPEAEDSLRQSHDGAVHYRVGDDICRHEMDLAEDQITSSVSRAEWMAAVAALHGGESQNVAQADWNGEGLPPVGTACEVDVSGVWISGVVLAHCLPPKEGFAVAQIDGEVGIAIGVEHDFRPIRTPEQIAEDEREKARDCALNTMTGEGWTEGETEEQWQFRLKIVSEMLDMGYRKPKPTESGASE